ncbi:TIGR02444 family protein [Aliidiomarina soli]|uniref:TIGR02444 family protein n=1 Tax=Aliidiomarina soli TaxID=1928574 RepID=A0A432WJM3_9GAMM|nr:TIGR02444 family protein [Aliidiomarina soli]RUO33965.1 TIGR02444 family protein [Aliidiomarina soli]
MAGTKRDSTSAAKRGLSYQTLWQAALQIYQEPGMQARLIAAQDNAGDNVNLALLQIYLQRQGNALSEAQFSQLAASLQPFSAQHTGQLRKLRRELLASEALDEKSRQQLKEHLLAAELTLEAVEQRLLVDLYNQL